MGTLRDELRAATLGAPSVQDKKLVEWGGKKFEVRRPTLKQTQSIQSLAKKKNGEVDDALALVQGIIHCVYAPGTDERVFEQADVDGIVNRGVEDFLGVFARALGELGSEATPKVVEGNSEGAPTV